MDPYGEILSLIRSECKKASTAPIQIGIMTGGESCVIGKLPLSGSDLLIAEHLKTGYHGKDAFVEPLKSGDQVAVCRISDERYIILERLV